MKIEILGPGCPKCRSLTVLVERVAKETGVSAEIVKVDDIGELVKRGVLSTPALAVDGEIKSVGRVPSVAEIRKWIGTE